MSTLRLYAAALTLVLWGAAEVFVGNSQVVVVVRLLTMAVAVFVSLRETVRVNGDRKRRRRG